MATKAVRPHKQDKYIAPVRVSVHDANGWPWQKNAEVELATGKTKTELKRVKGTAVYERSVPPGT